MSFFTDFAASENLDCQTIVHCLRDCACLVLYLKVDEPAKHRKTEGIQRSNGCLGLSGFMSGMNESLLQKAGDQQTTFKIAWQWQWLYQLYCVTQGLELCP